MQSNHSCNHRLKRTSGSSSPIYYLWRITSATPDLHFQRRSITPLLGQYQIKLLGDRSTCATDLPRVRRRPAVEPAILSMHVQHRVTPISRRCCTENIWTCTRNHSLQQRRRRGSNKAGRRSRARLYTVSRKKCPSYLIFSNSMKLWTNIHNFSHYIS